MNMKKLLTLAVLLTGLVSNLSINAMRQQGRQGGYHQYGERHGHHQGHGEHHHVRPIVQDVLDTNNVKIAGLLNVKENDKWVQYKKTTQNCPPYLHYNANGGESRSADQGKGRWQGHQHSREHGHGARTGHHDNHHFTKFQYNNKREKVDGVLNVFEDGACWVYVRTTAQKDITAAEESALIREQAMQAAEEQEEEEKASL